MKEDTLSSLEVGRKKDLFRKPHRDCIARLPKKLVDVTAARNSHGQQQAAHDCKLQ